MDDYTKLKSEGSDKSNKAKANKLLGNQGSAPDTIYSKSCADKEKIRTFRKGGVVKKSCK